MQFAHTDPEPFFIHVAIVEDDPGSGDALRQVLTHLRQAASNQVEGQASAVDPSSLLSAREKEVMRRGRWGS